MRLFLATAALCAYSALAQYQDAYDYDDELEARDARDAVWEAAHGGKAPSYRGFEDMAQHYPGHPVKSFGSKHNARDIADENGLGDDDGFIDATANLANNFVRAVKGAYDHVGSKAEEAVKHAKAQAGYDEDDWRQLQKGRHGDADRKGKHFAGYGEGGSWKFDRRDLAEDDEYDDDEDFSIYAHDVESEFGESEIDWDPSTRYSDDGNTRLTERDVAADDEDEPVAVAFDADDEEEEFPDPKLQLEQEFDEGLDDSSEGGLFQRDAEAFNFFGFSGKKDEHKLPDQAEFDARKKGMKHVFARDGGLNPDDDELDGAYDPISEDPNLTDEEFYGADEVEKRSMRDYME